MQLNILPDRQALIAAAALELEGALKSGIAARAKACAALSGGSAEAVYSRLAQAELDWRAVTIALVDERFVATDQPASNEGMLRRALAPALAQGARIAPMYAPVASLEEAAARADARYRRLHIDIALMGMGTDGHTASWFAGASGLKEALDPQSARSVVALRAPQAQGASERLTLTLPALARAERVLLLISGDDKRARLEQATRADDAPVAALFKPPLNADLFWAP